MITFDKGSSLNFEIMELLNRNMNGKTKDGLQKLALQNRDSVFPPLSQIFIEI